MSQKKNPAHEKIIGQAKQARTNINVLHTPYRQADIDQPDVVFVTNKSS